MNPLFGIFQRHLQRSNLHHLVGDAQGVSPGVLFNVGALPGQGSVTSWEIFLEKLADLKWPGIYLFRKSLQNVQNINTQNVKTCQN